MQTHVAPSAPASKLFASTANDPSAAALIGAASALAAAHDPALVTSDLLAAVAAASDGVKIEWAVTEDAARVTRTSDLREMNILAIYQKRERKTGARRQGRGERWNGRGRGGGARKQGEGLTRKNGWAGGRRKRWRGRESGTSEVVEEEGVVEGPASGRGRRRGRGMVRAISRAQPGGRGGREWNK